MGHRIEIPEGEYLKGLDEATEKLQSFVDNMVAASADGLADVALHILNKATQLAPVETGDLRGSGYVELEGETYAKVDQKTITKEEAKEGKRPPEPGPLLPVRAVPEDTTHAEIGFSTKYAANQHEQVEYDHPRGGQSKYLERVILDEQDKFQGILADRIIRAMMGGED